MRFVAGMGVLFLAGVAVAQTPANETWAELKSKREALSAAGQEFEHSRKVITSVAGPPTVRRIAVALAGRRWRERIGGDADAQIRIFDGKDVVVFDEGGSEFVREKRSKDREPV